MELWIPFTIAAAFFQNLRFMLQKHLKATRLTTAGATFSRFIFAAPLALKLGCSLAIARKPGKLPYETVSAEYSLEYGVDTLELHTDAFKPGEKVIIMDDLLATGGTAKAAGELVRKLKGDIVCFSFLINLVELKGVNMLKPHQVFCIVED